jgi:hypothetical protein
MMNKKVEKNPQKKKEIFAFKQPTMFSLPLVTSVDTKNDVTTEAAILK